MKIAARTELPAAERFSARIKSEGEMAGVPDTTGHYRRCR
jgi:hypothetical protein